MKVGRVGLRGRSEYARLSLPDVNKGVMLEIGISGTGRETK